MNASCPPVPSPVGRPASQHVVNIDGAGGCPVVTAISEETGERWVVRDADLYSAVVKVAEHVGMDLDLSSCMETTRLIGGS